MTPPSNAGGEGREVLTREVLANTAAKRWPAAQRALAIRLMLAFSARENADDRAPALVETAVAEMRERAAKVADDHVALGYMSGRERDYCHEHGDEIAELIRALPTPSQEAS